MASSQIEFASATSAFGCINHHHRVTQAKNLFNHFVRDPLENNTTTDNANNNPGTLRFASNKGEEQGESSSSSMNPSHEEPSPSSSPPPPSPLFPSQSPPFRKQRPSTIFVPSDFSPGDDVSNLGASSLVQIWEKRLNQSPLSATKSSSTPKSSRNTTTSSSSSPQSSSSSEEADSPQGQIHHHQSKRSILRVADIIKRLKATSSEDTANNNNQDHQNYCVGSPENRRFVINSPRIRGRQAFNDLLMQMERDRHDELRNLADCAPVSNFPYRGRIQSLLRLRLMQRGMVAKDYQRCFPSRTSQVTKKLPRRSIIMRLRERFGTGIKNKANASIEVVEHETPGREKENKVSPIYNIPPNPTQNPVSHTDHNNKEEEEEAPPCSDVLVPSLEAQNAKTSSSSMADMNAEPETLDNDEEIEEKCNNVYDEMEEEEEGGSEEEEYGERVYEEIEEVEINYGSEADNFDWISQISKPKSYWEDLRQAWYKEMADNNESQKDDICQLLQRRTVSNFLCSDFRDKMDKLMESHNGTQANLLAAGQDDNEPNHHGKIGHELVAILQQQMNNNPLKRDKEEDDVKAEAEEEEEEEENQEEEEEEEEEEEIVISSSYNGESDSMNQSSPSQPSQSPSFFLHTHQISSPSRPPSIEMELIYDLGGHMKQLHQEMSELRNSIRSCIDMQIILQKSLNHSAKGKKSRDRVLKKGNCRICSNMKADSLFYRCGHMCTCLKCANELQQKNGMCPICEAPIVDVVRVYVDA